MQTNVRSTAGQFSFVASDHRLPERASVDGERPGQAERPSVGLLRRGDAASFRPIPGRSIDRRGIPQPAVPETRSSPVSPCPMDRFGKRNREQVLRKRPNSEASEEQSRYVCPVGSSLVGKGDGCGYMIREYQQIGINFGGSITSESLALVVDRADHDHLYSACMVHIGLRWPATPLESPRTQANRPERCDHVLYCAGYS